MLFGKKKLAPKGVKLCPGCPPREIKPVVAPKFVMPLPSSGTDSTKVTTIVNLNKKKSLLQEGGRQNSLF